MTLTVAQDIGTMARQTLVNSATILVSIVTMDFLRVVFSAKVQINLEKTILAVLLVQQDSTPIT